MEYSDNLIPSAEDFAKMAKEYSSRLKREKTLDISSENETVYLSNINLILKDLIFLYNYIKRNIRSVRLKSIFLYMEEECLSDSKKIEPLLANKSKNTDKNKKHFNNFHSCVRLAISHEADLLNNFINLLNFQSKNLFKEISMKHLDFIKRLSNF